MVAKLIVRNCDQIVQVCSEGERYKVGDAQDRLALLERRSKGPEGPEGVGLSLVIGLDGKITEINYDDCISAKDSDADAVIDGKGCSLIPGLVDAHTHPVWAGDRLFEFDLKMRGATYLDIHEKGGGIHFTVERSRQAAPGVLLARFLERLELMASCGTTTVECKSGYGLDFETESKLLDVIEEARKKSPLDLVSTFLGAHAVPRGMKEKDAVANLVAIMQRMGAEKRHNIDFVDVFCEKGVFELESSRQILNAGKKYLGALPGFHGDELFSLGAGELAEEVGARSVSHLEFVSDAGIEAMARAKTVGIVCPTTAYLLRLQSPPVRKMIAARVPVAVATDFNPNAYCYSLPMAMNLGVVKCELTLNEALAAATINAAYALNRSETHGSLEVGKVGDCVLLKTLDWRNLIYQFGDSKQLIKHVIKKGEVIV